MGSEISLLRDSLIFSLLSHFLFLSFEIKKNKIIILGRFLSKKYLYFLFFRERDQNTNHLGLGSGDNKIKQGCSDLAGRWRSAFTIESLAFQNSQGACAQDRIPQPPPLILFPRVIVPAPQGPGIIFFFFFFLRFSSGTMDL